MKAELVCVACAFEWAVLAFPARLRALVGSIIQCQHLISSSTNGMADQTHWHVLRNVTHFEVHLVGDTFRLEHIIKHALAQPLTLSASSGVLRMLKRMDCMAHSIRASRHDIEGHVDFGPTRLGQRRQRRIEWQLVRWRQERRGRRQSRQREQKGSFEHRDTCNEMYTTRRRRVSVAHDQQWGFRIRHLTSSWRFLSQSEAVFPMFPLKAFCGGGALSTRMASPQPTDARHEATCTRARDLLLHACMPFDRQQPRSTAPPRGSLLLLGCALNFTLLKAAISSYGT